MLPICVHVVKQFLCKPIIHHVVKFFYWTLFMGQPKIQRMDTNDVSHDPPKLLDRMREEIRVRHYSIRTEETYIDWARRYILFHNKRHP
jgi:hypothetical protein